MVDGEIADHAVVIAPDAVAAFADIVVARRVQNRYMAMRLDLTDATNVSLAERYETVEVLTLDRRDFRAVTPLTGHAAFRLLPDDL